MLTRQLLALSYEEYLLGEQRAKIDGLDQAIVITMIVQGTLTFTTDHYVPYISG